MKETTKTEEAKLRSTSCEVWTNKAKKDDDDADDDADDDTDAVHVHRHDNKIVDVALVSKWERVSTF